MAGIMNITSYNITYTVRVDIVLYTKYNKLLNLFAVFYHHDGLYPDHIMNK